MLTAPPKVAHVTTVDVTLRFLLMGQLTALRREGFEVYGVSRSGPWTADLMQAGIGHYTIPHLTRHVNPAADIVALAELVRLFRRERFAIVHTHMAKSGVLGRLAARLAGVPIIVNTIHGPYGITPGHPGRRFFLALERFGASLSHAELCQSREILDQLIRFRVLDASRASHLGNGVDLDHFSPDSVEPQALERLRRTLGISGGTVVVGTVGRLVHDKGYREFIAAAEGIASRRRDVCFLAVGPEEPEKADAVSAQEIRRGEAAGVRFLGMRMDMRELYALMDIFVLASYREGFPRSAIEAAAMGKPLVVSDIPGCRDVVRDGVNGILVPVRNVEPLEQAIERLLNDADLRQRLGSQGRQYATDEFDERRVTARVVATYRRLLSDRTQFAVRGRGVHDGKERAAH